MISWWPLPFQKLPPWPSKNKDLLIERGGSDGSTVDITALSLSLDNFLASALAPYRGPLLPHYHYAHYSPYCLCLLLYMLEMFFIHHPQRGMWMSHMPILHTIDMYPPNRTRDAPLASRVTQIPIYALDVLSCPSHLSHGTILTTMTSVLLLGMFLRRTAHIHACLWSTFFWHTPLFGLTLKEDSHGSLDLSYP